MRLLWLCALVVALLPSEAAARDVRVRGGARLLAQATFIQDRSVLELRGQLSDDARQPIEGAWIELTSESELGPLRACREPRVKVTPAGDALRTQTAVGGELCLRWTEPPDAGEIALRFPGDPYHGAADLTVSFDRSEAQRLATTLRFDPRPMVLDLDEDQIVVSGVLDLALDTVHAKRQGLPIELKDDRDQLLATAKTAGDGRVRLLVDPSDLAGPGSGELDLSFSGTEDLAPAHDEQPVTRRTTVRMRLSDPVEAADPGDTATIQVKLESVRGPVDGGVVEALQGGASLGSAQVEDGRAALVVAIDPEQRTPPVLSLRYLPSSPFYEPGSMLSVEVPIAPPSIALRVLLTLVVLAAGVWVTLSWRRSREPPKAATEPTLTPGVHVVRSHARDDGRWNGVVVDAHEGTPIGGATIRVRAPTLEDDDVLVATEADDEGRFSFELERRPDGAELVAEGRMHSEQRKELPTAGTLRIALVTRRRVLLRRLVRWARSRGAPYHTEPDPTPAHVRSVASARRKPEVEQWAGAVERAAFGRDRVDESVEEEVREAEPHG